MKADGQYLRACGISVWMITGDKPNTAISIGRSTGIIDAKATDREVLLLDRTETLRDAKAVLDQLAAWTRDVEAQRMGSQSCNESKRTFRSRSALPETCSPSSLPRSPRITSPILSSMRSWRSLCASTPSFSAACSPNRRYISQRTAELNSPKSCC